METLEEASERLYPYDGVNEDYTIDSKRWSFVSGAKWQQERSYSEEDMMDYSNYRLLIKKALNPKEWFEQFKNK